MQRKSSKPITLTSLGLLPVLSGENLVKAVSVLTDLVSQIKGASESLSSIEKAVSDEVKTLPTLVAEAGTLGDKLREIVFAETDANPLLGIHLHSLLSDIAETVRDDADYAVTIEANKRKPKAFDGDTQTLITLAEEAKTFTEGLIVGMQSMKIPFPKEGIEWTEKHGKKVVKLPNVPKTVRTGGGRKSKASQLRYIWNGDVLETSLIPEIVRTHINSGLQRFSVGGLTRQVNTHDFSNAGQLEVSYPTGTLIVCLPPKDEVAPEEDIETDDTDTDEADEEDTEVEE